MESTLENMAAPSPRVGMPTRRMARPSEAEPTDGGASTRFQPALLADELRQELATDGERAWSHWLDGSATVEPRAGHPVEPVETGLYLLQLGAPPGEERRSLDGARTVLGRGRRSGLVIDDAAVSSCHCRIDVLGGECYVRDLDSKNGTFLNGHKVRYSQILPGDELRLGETTLVFRSSGDGFQTS